MVLNGNVWWLEIMHVRRKEIIETKSGLYYNCVRSHLNKVRSVQYVHCLQS